MFKLGTIASLTVKDYRALNNPVLHAVPNKMSYWRNLEHFVAVVKP